MPLPFPLNPALNDLPVYQPGRPIDEVAREVGLPAEEIIKLASNENPLGPSPRALAAMQSVLKSLHLYPDGNAFYLKRKLAKKRQLDPSQLILGNGSNEILEFVAHALLTPGSETVVSQYCFAIYPIVTRLAGATPVVVPAKSYGHDLAAMLRAVTPKTKVMFVANPNNPTGTLLPAQGVLSLINDLPPRVVLALDEAYIDFLTDPLDLLQMVRSGQRPNLLLIRTFSKIFGLAGLRLGYGMGHPELIAALEKVRQPFNINSIAQAGALAALDDVDHLEQTRKNNAVGLQFFENAFREMKLEFVPSAANFILVRVADGGQIFDQLQKRGVIVRPMGGYDLPEWIRISIGTPQENQKCLDALKAVLSKSGKK